MSEIYICDYYYYYYHGAILAKNPGVESVFCHNVLLYNLARFPLSYPFAINVCVSFYIFIPTTKSIFAVAISGRNNPLCSIYYI